MGDEKAMSAPLSLVAMKQLMQVLIGMNESTEKRPFHHGDTEVTEKIMVVHREKHLQTSLFLPLCALCLRVEGFFSKAMNECESMGSGNFEAV